MTGSGRGGAASGDLGPPLPQSFFDRPVLEVAPDLLGALITHERVTIRLTEVEAYDGQRDPGSHAYRGMTPRTEVMFGPAGGLYVYFTYGLHYCANLVCGPQGMAAAVLLRAGEVVAGADLATTRRTRPGSPAPRPRDLARGPARLTVALGLGRDDNGLRVTAPGSPVSVHLPAGLGPWAGAQATPGTARPQPQGRAVGTIRTGPRVGVAGPGGDGEVYPWRFWLEGEPTVSTYRPGVRRRRAR